MHDVQQLHQEKIIKYVTICVVEARQPYLKLFHFSFFTAYQQHQYVREICSMTWILMLQPDCSTTTNPKSCIFLILLVQFVTWLYQFVPLSWRLLVQTSGASGNKKKQNPTRNFSSRVNEYICLLEIGIFVQII